MKLNDQQKERLKALKEFIPELMQELANDTATAWQRAETKEKREDAWHLTRAIKKLSSKFSLLIKEAETREQR